MFLVKDVVRISCSDSRVNWIALAIIIIQVLCTRMLVLHRQLWILRSFILNNQRWLLKLTHLRHISHHETRLNRYLWTPMLSQLLIELYWIKLLWTLRAALMVEWLIVVHLDTAHSSINVSNLWVISPGVVHVLLYLGLIVIVVLLEVDKHQSNIVFAKIVHVAFIRNFLTYLL